MGKENSTHVYSSAIIDKTDKCSFYLNVEIKVDDTTKIVKQFEGNGTIAETIEELKKIADEDLMSFGNESA